MKARRCKTVLCLAGGAAFACASLLLLAGPASAHRGASRVTAVTVTLGKPSELGITLSKWSALPVGTIVFKVTNRGALAHTFQLCQTPGSSLKPNTCKGPVTRLLKTGESQTLTVVLKKAGKYEYLCTVPGHASSGMKGQLGVGVKVAAKTSEAVAGAAGPAAASAAPATAGATCVNPQNTTVNVNEFDYGFSLSRYTIPCGNVTFAQVNTGSHPHNFTVAGSTGATIQSGQRTTTTVDLTPGSYRFVCNVNGHEALGMAGTLTVTA